jgi:tetratricopeptide (TPR) repeat protein
VAHATIELAYQLGRFGNRDEALQLFDQGIAQYEALVKEGGNPDTIRDLAASELRRGQVNLMRVDPAAAIVDFHRARDSTARLLKLDPKNVMLQSDVCGFDHDEGRALVVSGRVAQGLVLLQRSLQCFHDLHLEADTGPGTGAMEAWIAEAQASSRNLPEALKHYQTAAAALAADIDKYDDARCDLAMVETRIANTLLQMGKLSEASEHYAKALDLARLPFSLEHMDIPAVSATKGCTHGVLLTCKLGQMSPGTSKTVTVTLLPTVPGWTQATAGIRLTTPDRDFTNNSAANSIWINP